MASLTEIISRAEQLATGRGADIHNNPVTDSAMTAEALFPHALKYCLERSMIEDLEDTIVEHDIIVSNQEGALPEEVLSSGLKSGFLPDFPYSSLCRYPDFNRDKFSNMLCYWTIKDGRFFTDCQGDQWKLLRTLTGCSSNGTALTNAGTPDSFVNGDAGRRVVILDSGNNILVDTTISSVANLLTATLADDIGLEVGLTAQIYTPYVYVLDRTLVGTLTVNANEFIFNVPANGDMTSDDIGKRVVILDGSGQMLADSLITVVKSLSTADFDLAAFNTPYATATASLYQVGDNVITLACPSVPELPTDPTADIHIPRQVVEDIIAVIASCLTGEMKLREVM